MSLLERLQKVQKEKPAAAVENKKAAPPPPRKDPYARLKASIHRKLIAQVETLEGELLPEKISQIAGEILDGEVDFLPGGEREKILREIVAEAVGYGPIHGLLLDENISEIMVNGPEHV